MRINKYIASSGLCSRRKAEEFIAAQQVTINGEIAVLSSTVQPGDVVKLNGQIVEAKEEFVVLMLNKPKGITCTTELNIEGNIIDYINYPQRIFPIGRLDKDSTGLILLTNNGDLVNQCLRVENGHEKEYIVRVDKDITDDFLNKMAEGVKIFNPVTNSEVITLPCTLSKLGRATFSIVLKQGLNRQIRRMCSALGYNVLTLKRMRFMHIHLDVKEGEYRLLSESEVNKLLRILNEKQQ